MEPASLDALREVVRVGEPGRLVGLAECAWFDVKSSIYVLDRPQGAQELLKDVAAFANARDGGLLLVGFSTRVVNGQEIVDEVRPVPRSAVDLDRHRKLLDRIIPVPMYVTVDWIDCGDEKGILVIDVPAQRHASRPYVVPGPARAGTGDQLAGAVPVRDGDRTRWLSVSDLQRLLAAGWSDRGGQSEEVLRGLVSQAVAAAARAADRPAAPVIQPGEGDQAWEQRFREAAAAVRDQVRLGRAAGRVYHEGPGPVQHFDGHAGEAWVLCAVPGQRPVLVAGPVWERVREAGSGAPGADAFTALGFPVLGRDVQPPDRVVTSIGRVELGGGTWGPGFLLRTHHSTGFYWEAAPRFTFNVLQEGSSWTSAQRAPELRVRATALLPAATADTLITPYQADRLAEELRYTDLDLAVQNLAWAHGPAMPASPWQAGRTGRSTDRVSFARTVAAPGGETGLAAEVMLFTTSGPVVAVAELRIESTAAWQAALEAAGAHILLQSQRRLSLYQVWQFLSASWHAVTHDLPAVLSPDLTLGPFSAPPAVELRLSAEQAPEQGAAQCDLTDLIDFSPVGTTDRQPLPLMTVTASGPIRLSDADRPKRVREAIAYMAQGFGFTNPDADLPPA